jgi:ankyrin repeat protein
MSTRRRSAVAVALVISATSVMWAQGRQFRSADEARAWLKSEGLTTDPSQLLMYLSSDSPKAPDVMRAYVALELPLDRPARPDGLAPLTLVTRSCVGNPMAEATTTVLVQAGANPGLPAPDGDKTTPLMEAVSCPAVLKAMLARKSDLSVVDAKGYTVMHHALSSYEAREEVSRLVLDAGFDLPKWRPALLKAFGNDPASRALLEGRSTTATATPTPPAPRGAVDWTAVGPYPARSAAAATALLARPGTDLTANDHFWDAINQREPLRLAVALQAGASARQRSLGADYTPLMSLADRCDDRDVPMQVSLVEQLVAAQADVTAVSANKSNALMIGARKCPLAVVRLFIAAGVPVNGIDTAGNTAMKSAILNGRADVVTALIEAGVDPRKEPYNAGRMATGNKEVEAALKQRPRK